MKVQCSSTVKPQWSITVGVVTLVPGVFGVKLVSLLQGCHQAL